MRENQSFQGDYIFALDIGTRSVIGIVGKMVDGLLHVVDMEKVPHTTRAMVDGQIEDIDEVAKVAQQVKTALEQRLSIQLNQVCVAAAGRTLQTHQSTFAMDIKADEAVDRQLLYHLDMGAIDAAQSHIDQANQEENLQLSCVGYSVLRYFLDDYPMSTILGHKGKRAGVEMIATFLPNQVVDSLRAAMSKIDLHIAHLTLEPIAAMNAVIPNELRLLNLALVDIGAGTSDIALSNKGSVAAYTMATVAGDEITEAIMRKYLVDFHIAEQMKLALADNHPSIPYTDILGFEYEVARDELLEVIRPGVGELAEVICTQILSCNQTAPAAVFLVGGGSKVPLLCEAVSAVLDIDPRKVAVGGNNYMKKQTNTTIDLSDPEFATPLGIALTAASSNRLHALHVFVNEKKVQLLQGSDMTVMNALLLCGYKYSNLMGKSGKSFYYQLNGERKVARGGLPQPAGITVNGKAGSLATPITSGDKIVIVPCVSGADAKLYVKDLLDSPTGKTVLLDNTPVVLRSIVLVNGVAADLTSEIREDDVVVIRQDDTVRALLQLAGKSASNLTVTVNGEQVGDKYLLKDGDVVTTTTVAPPTTPVSSYEGSIRVTLNRHSVELPPKPEGTPYLFLDMLNFVDIDPTNPQGDILLRHNGKSASYLDVIADGDDIQITWEKR